MAFPHTGSWFIYADGVPDGLGQQVMRFDAVLDAPSASTQRDVTPTGFLATDDGYTAQFDSFALKAGQEAHLSLHLLHDGAPAADITPFLGVAAHAVFIDAADLSYVHVHAAPAEAAVMTHDAAGMEGMGAPLAAGAKVPPDLALHVVAPKAGTYVLWLQFNGDGTVRTVRFVVPVS